MPHKNNKPRKGKRTKREHYKKKEIFQDGIRRHPRPLGLTYLNLTRLNTQLKQENESIEENKDKTNKAYQNMIQLCIQLYVREGMQWLGKQIPIPEFATYLNINPERLLILMNKELERLSGFFEGKEGRHLARGLLSRALFEALESLALTKGQAKLLIAQQGNEYVPFLTGEANKALGNLISAQKPLQDLLSKFTDKSPINILINNNGESSTSGTDYLTPEQALQLLHNNGTSLLNNPELIDAQEKELGALPDVVARNQDLSKIGVKIPNKVISKDGKNLHEDHIEDAQIIPDDTLKAEDFIK